MKTRLLIIPAIIVFFSANVVFAQTDLLVGLPVALFKTDNNTYEIQYDMTNGTLVSSLVDLPARELIFTFNATEDGQITIILPREIIDSKRNEADKPFLVFVGDLNSGVKRTSAIEIQNNNEIRILTINFTKNENQIGIVGTYFIENNSSSTTLNPFGVFTPLQQYKKGIDSHYVICKSGLQLIIKPSNDYPTCVKPETKAKLIERGWAEPLGDIVSQRPSQTKSESDDTLSESNYVPHSPRCGSGVVPYIPDNWQTTGMHPSDETWEALGNYLMKQEFYKELQSRNIVFEPTCFGVYTGLVDEIYPPSYSMCSVVTASNGTTLYLEGTIREFDVTYFDIDNEMPYQCDDNQGSCLCGIENEN